MRQYSSGTASGTIQDCYAPTLVQVSSGACTATGDHNSYIASAVIGDGDVAVADSGKWLVHPLSHEPALESPLMEAGVRIAGLTTDARGRPLHARPAIGPLEAEYNERDCRTGRNFANVRQARAA